LSAEPTPLGGRRNPPTKIPLKIEEMLAAAAMALMVVITLANVVTRYVTDISFAFTEEYSIALMVIVTLLGTAIATAANRHIRIGFFVDRLSPRAQRRVGLLAMLPVIAIFAVLVWLGALSTYDEYRFEVTSPALGVPQWIYTVWLPVLSLVVVLRAVGRLIRIWRGAEL
jgi:TRAP-type transport system small permease protein